MKLEVANSGSSKTRIMLAANLSFQLSEKYLETAVGAGLFLFPGQVTRYLSRVGIFLGVVGTFWSGILRFRRLLRSCLLNRGVCRSCVKKCLCSIRLMICSSEINY